MQHEYQDILVSEVVDGVLTITLNRPEAYNALRTQLLSELADVLQSSTDDDSVRAVVVTGNEKVFAAGADIKEMAALDTVGVLNDPRVQHWRTIAQFPKPLIAAVNGFALGGGCELERKSTRLNSSHVRISNAVFSLKKKKKKKSK